MTKLKHFLKNKIVSPDLVKEYLEHLTNIEVRKNMRQDEKRQAKKEVTVTITGRNSTNRKPKKAEGC